MRSWKQAAVAWLSIGMVALGCASPQSRVGAGPGAHGTSPASAPAPFQRVTAAVMSDLPTLNSKYSPRGREPGHEQVEDMTNAGLTIVDHRGVRRPQLAEAVPSIENGLWKLSPDGRMETTWNIRENVLWHDGVPFTAEDLAFTATVGRDREIPVSIDEALRFIESVEAPDPRTVVVKWRQPYIEADVIFSHLRLLPLPRHLLDKPYREDKARFMQLPYWSEEFVGTGPFKLAEWVRGSHLVLRANDQYALGRPKVDEVIVKFIPDPNAVVANLLAGSVDITLGRGISLEQAIQIRDQWRDGRVEIALASWIVIIPKLIDPNPAVVADLRFRRALLHAIDRQQMADTIQYGMVPVAHSMLAPGPEFAEIDRFIVRYDYDPGKAAQLIQEMGYQREPDGGFRDSAGRRLSVEARASPSDINQKSLFAVADYWQRLGVGVDQVVIPRQLSEDQEYRSAFPAFDVGRQGNDLYRIAHYHSSEFPLPENGFRGRNKPKYVNPDYDALTDRYQATIPKGERLQLVGQMIHYMTDQLVMMGLFYDTQPLMIGNRLANVTVAKAENTNEVWNSNAWEKS